MGKVAEGKRRLEIIISDEEYYDIYERSYDAGMSMSEFIRDRLNRKSDVILDLNMNDITRLVSEFEDKSRMIASIIPVILKSEVVTLKDMEGIVKGVKDMNDKVIEIYKTIRNDRYRLYEEAKKRIYRETDRRKRTNKIK